MLDWIIKKILRTFNVNPYDFDNKKNNFNGAILVGVVLQIIIRAAGWLWADSKMDHWPCEYDRFAYECVTKKAIIIERMEGYVFAIDNLLFLCLAFFVVVGIVIVGYNLSKRRIVLGSLNHSYWISVTLKLKGKKDNISLQPFYALFILLGVVLMESLVQLLYTEQQYIIVLICCLIALEVWFMKDKAPCIGRSIIKFTIKRKIVGLWYTAPIILGAMYVYRNIGKHYVLNKGLAAYFMRYILELETKVIELVCINIHKIYYMIGIIIVISTFIYVNSKKYKRGKKC